MSVKRFLNYSEAVDYFGAKRKWFDAEIREYVDWQQAGACKLVARVDLDRAWDEYVARRARGEKKTKREEGQWQDEGRPASTRTKRTARGRSTRSGNVVEFEAAFEAVTKRKLTSSAESPS